MYVVYISKNAGNMYLTLFSMFVQCDNELVIKMKNVICFPIQSNKLSIIDFSMKSKRMRIGESSYEHIRIGMGDYHILLIINHLL